MNSSRVLCTLDFFHGPAWETVCVCAPTNVFAEGSQALNWPGPARRDLTNTQTKQKPLQQTDRVLIAY